jgi:hypothetical protein
MESALAMKVEIGRLELDGLARFHPPTFHPENGFTVSGLCLFGAYLDEHRNALVEPRQYEQMAKIPHITITASKNDSKKKKSDSDKLFRYDCPIYTNGDKGKKLISKIGLKSGMSPSFWLLRKVQIIANESYLMAN